MVGRIARTVLVAGLTLGSVIAPAFAGTVVGKVELGTTGLYQAVVSIEGVPGAVEPQRVVITQRNKEFIPHVVAVPKGSVVELSNDDDFLHNTFSRSSAKVFNLNQPGKGSRSLLKVDQPGVIQVQCHIHGQMQAWIIVVDTPHFATTDTRGIFRIEGVPAGTYHVKTWTEGHGVLTQEVRVPATGTAPVIFKYTR